MAFKFELVSPDGETLGSIETSEANWQAGDEPIGHGNTHYRITAVIPLELVQEFVEPGGDELSGVLEVEPLTAVGH
jgi:hypothetical protein